MSDRAPIEDLVHRYADAVVHHDEARWAATWADDAVWVLGPGHRAEGREAIVGAWAAAMDGFAAVVQHVFNGTYELDEAAGTGTGRWYVTEHWAALDGTRGLLLGYYDDEYVRADRSWCFARRELAVQYAGPPDMSAPFLNAWA